MSPDIAKCHLGNKPHPVRTAALEDDPWRCFLEQIPPDSQEAHLGKAGKGMEKGRVWAWPMSPPGLSRGDEPPEK